MNRRIGIWLLVLGISVALLATAGCITPTARRNIAAHRDNAAEFDARIQAALLAADPDAPLPQWVKDWSELELRAWDATVAWSESRRPTTQPSE